MSLPLKIGFPRTTNGCKLGEENGWAKPPKLSSPYCKFIFLYQQEHGISRLFHARTSLCTVIDTDKIKIGEQ